MKLIDAISKSPVKAAYRPWEILPEVVSEEVRKYIVVSGKIAEPYVVWANSFTYVRDVLDSESDKLIGKTDWEPVGLSTVWTEREEFYGSDITDTNTNTDTVNEIEKGAE